jgi:checkpoint serine/threonine-protein kinase
LAFCIQSLPQFTNPQTIIPLKEQLTVNQRNGRQEKIFVNLEAVYPTPEVPGTELSFEELRASTRGWLQKKWKPERVDFFVLEDAKSLTPQPLAFEEAKDVALSKVLAEKLVIPRDLVIFDENGAVKEVGREGRSRKLKTMEVNETQISMMDHSSSIDLMLTRAVKTKLSSPSGKKLKRKASAEPTMTFHTRAATDEIYDLFNQPLKSSIEEEDDDESDQDDGDETDGDYTSGGESTGTGRLITTSEAGDDETSEVKSVSEWSEFTARKHIPNLDDDDEDNTRESEATGEDDQDEIMPVIEPIKPKVDIGETDEIVTPVSPEPPRTMYIPIPPEDYVPPTRPYRDPSQTSQNRLPFMTPIAEKTESSLGAETSRDEKDYFNSKTPTKVNRSKAAVLPTDDLMSSPFQEIVNESLPRQKIPQPALGQLTKTNKTAAIAAKVQASGGPLAKEIAPKGSIIKDAQCNPVDDYTRNLVFQGLQPPLSTYEGFFDHKTETAGKSIELKKFTKAIAKVSKNSSDKTTTNISMPPILSFPGTDRKYMVKKELGAGAFAPVYLIENLEDEDIENENDPPAAVMGKGTFDHFGRKSLEALKMEDPPTAWEFYIMRQAKRRLGVSRAAESLINVYEMHLYEDECFLVEEYRDQGTLLDLINIARADSTAATGVMDECLVMFFTIELFRTVEALHSKGLLHGDLKADNCLVRFDPINDDMVWTPRYRRDGSGGWNQKGLALIDFGRGIDMKVFRPDVQFIADWKTSAQDCAEMRELRPWTYQIDYHGVAGIIHSMLFGKYIDTIADRAAKLGAGATKTYRIKENLKRYWQQEIWSGIFDLLLNPLMHLEGEEGTKMPVLKGMKRLREMMEEWVEANCDKGLGLQAAIRKLENTIQGRRR